ncbi:MAG: helix-turn-helix transcriptional regulator [Clostridia bacterium]|nr:helix-turn-helix transcriptional regulator [Clostridia bacterium]
MISEKIKNLRKSKSLTQEEMAQILGCSVASVSGYETGKTEVPRTVIKIYEEYFNCPFEYFFDDDVPLMETPEILQKKSYRFKLKVIKDLTRPVAGNNIYKEINHIEFDQPYGRVAWLVPDTVEETIVILIVDAIPREGEKVAVITDDGQSKLGYYYIDENHNVCIKSKPKGCKGIRNLKVDLKKGGRIYGIVEATYTK